MSTHFNISLLLLLLSIIPYNLSAQDVNIPDIDFLHALIDQDVDLNADSIIQLSEAALTTELLFDDIAFESAQGIEAFANLESFFMDGNNLITTIDVRELSKLTFFGITFCPNMNQIILGEHNELETFRTRNTIVESLDLSNLPSLSFLDMVKCDSLKNLNLSGTSNITNMNLGLGIMEFIDLSDLELLGRLTLGGNPDITTEVKWGQMPSLEELRMSRSGIETMDFSYFPNLKEFNLTSIYGGSLESLYISDHNSLENVWIETSDSLKFVTFRNLSALKSVVIKRMANLEELVFDSIYSDAKITMEDCAGDIDLTISNSPELTDLTLHRLRALRNLSLENLPSLADISIVNADSLEVLDFSRLTGLDDYSLNFLPSLKYLFIKNGNFENPRCDCPALEYVCGDDFDDFSRLPEDVIFNSFCPYLPDASKEIRGLVQYDTEQDGCDANDPIVPFFKLAVLNPEQEELGALFSNQEGNYELFYDSEEITLVPAESQINSNFNYTPDSIYINPTDTLPLILQNICISADELYDDIELVISNELISRPGVISNYEILVKNNGTTIPSGAIILEYERDFLTFRGAEPQPTSISQSEIQWDLPTLFPFREEKIKIDFELNTPVHPEFPLDGTDTLKYTIRAELDAPIDIDVFENTLCDNVVNSFDPNDKECLQGNELTIDEIGSFLYYKIRFENLGNASALNIFIQDTLDMNSFDISTLEVLDASHRVVTQMENNIVSFIFNNIDLGFLDHENDGFVLFKVKTLPSLQIDHSIKNEAAIYFDYNSPVITNIAETIVVDEEIIISSTIDTQIEKLKVYPTPTNEMVYIENPILNAKVSIVDIHGKIMFEYKFDLFSKLNVSDLAEGIYYLHVETENQKFISKIIKQ